MRQVGLVRRMQDEWQALTGVQATGVALTRWGRAYPALAGYADMVALKTATEDRSNKVRSDAILAALVRLGARDGGNDLLAVRVLLQLLLPGAIRLAQRMTAITGDPLEAESDVLDELTVLIRTYPWQRRPRRIAANLLLDCQQRLTRAARRHCDDVPVGLQPIAEDEPDPAAGREGDERVEVIDLFLWAQTRGVLTREEALLLAAHRVDEIQIRQLTGPLGRCATGLFVLRNNAEARLRDALTQAA